MSPSFELDKLSVCAFESLKSEWLEFQYENMEISPVSEMSEDISIY